MTSVSISVNIRKTTKTMITTEEKCENNGEADDEGRKERERQ